MSQFIVPAGQGQNNEQRRRDAAESAKGIADSRAYIYLVSSKVPKDIRGKAEIGDFWCGEYSRNFGKSFYAIVLGHQTRYELRGTPAVPGEQGPLLWSKTMDEMTGAEQRMTEWGPNKEKPQALSSEYFALLYVDPERGLDPHKWGPLYVKWKGFSAGKAYKFLDAMKKRAKDADEPVPVYAQVWKFESTELDRNDNPLWGWEYAGSTPPSEDARLRNMFTSEQADMKRPRLAAPDTDEGPTHADRIAQASADRAAQADRGAANAVRETFGGKTTEYATALDADEEVKPAETVEYQTPPANGEPMLFDAELKLGFHWGSVFRTGVDKPAVPIRDMTKSEVEAAIEYADQQPVTNQAATTASRMLTRWLAHISGPLYGSNDGTAAPPFFD